ncbi:MAG: hypothetical protein ACXU7Z_00720, partial [Burkholderiaceae bacterium]
MSTRTPSSNCMRYICSAIFLFLMSAAGAQTVAQQSSNISQPPVLLDMPDAASNASVKQYLFNKARSTNNVRLIVKLRIPVQPENLLDVTQLQSQRNAITVAQDNF